MKHLADRLQPMIHAMSARVPFAFQRRLFGNAQLDRLNNLARWGFDPEFVLDIGAYVGRWTQSASGVFPRAKFLMVEAQAAKRPALEAVAACLKGNARVEICLLGRDEAERTFFEMETGSSMYEELSQVGRTATVKRTKPIDTVVAQAGFPRVDLAKLDVQGAELDVLAGGPELLRTTPVFLMEAAVRPYNAGAPLIGDVIAFMAERGYRMFDLCEVKRIKPSDLPLQLDLLFARPDGPLSSLLG